MSPVLLSSLHLTVKATSSLKRKIWGCVFLHVLDPPLAVKMFKVKTWPGNSFWMTSLWLWNPLQHCRSKFLQSSLVEEQKGFYYYYYFSSRGNFTQTVCYVFSQHSRSNQQFWSHCSPLTLYYPKKINPFPALPADSPRQQRGRTEAQANNVTFLPLQPHTVKTRLGNVIM